MGYSHHWIIGQCRRTTRWLADLIARRPSGVLQRASSWSEITDPQVERWEYPEHVTLAVLIELPDGRSLQLGALAGQEAAAVGPVAEARTLVTARSARVNGFRFALSTDLCLLVAGREPVTVPMFNSAAPGLRAILAELASVAGEDACVYDNLDQGWALRLGLRGAFLEVVEWNWDAEDPSPWIAWRLERDAVQAEAVRIAAQFEQVHARLVEVTGEDWWSSH